MAKKKKVMADSSLYYVAIDKHGKKVLKKKGFFTRLVDSNDTTVAASTIFLLLTCGIGLFLLIVPGIALLIEVCFNHTISTDLSGMGVYIGAVSTLFLLGGLLKGWTNYSTYKYRAPEARPQEEIEYDMDEGPELDA